MRTWLCFSAQVSHTLALFVSPASCCSLCRNREFEFYCSFDTRRCSYWSCRCLCRDHAKLVENSDAETSMNSIVFQERTCIN
ncbi:uncharacterized protein HD556DRAFT_1418193 [Suillus plorans]|uniref:Secreted protein n=1 Tax=Suillus plorans TaxID=116603 RepID=A0A9P7DBD1_9AGAM|nr:uncharacterized protein HD556DRAFT_1418193 [Suillus plorans]KAG1785958.1 hypothetical protein HD556DRAFT_1418193 [Suillus plorans]